MSRRSTPGGLLGKTALAAELEWVNQPGRVPSRTSSFAHGFRGRSPLASVAVVAECSIDDPDCARSAVAKVRDAFADGVAYGVNQVLEDAFQQVKEDWEGSGHGKCSAAAVAVLGNQAWVISTGSCHAFMADPGSMGSIDLDTRVRDGEASGARRVVLREGQSIVLVTRNLKKLMGSTAAAMYTTGCPDQLDTCLRALVSETRIRFRKTGGSVAAMRYRKVPEVFPRRRLTCAVGAALLVAIAALLWPGLGGRGENDADDPAVEAPVRPQVIMPLETDTVATLPAEEPAPPDPISAIILGESDPAGLDTVQGIIPTVTGEEPDTRWENARSGIYYLPVIARADTLARLISSTPAGEGLPLIPVSSIVTVRQGEVSSFASWLRGLTSEEAGSTAVLVETTTSVAGGAEWIRDYALFANGNREMSALPSTVAGTPPEGIPAVADTSGYTLIIVR